MARPVNPEAVAKKRQEILGAAQRFVFTKGYEQMSIQDILDEVKISSGAFHHYFASRSALLEAFIEHIQQELGKPFVSIVADPNLSAIEKLQSFFDTQDRMRNARKVEVVQLLRVWYTDANALVRQKVDEAVRQQRSPLMTEIVYQGIRENLFAVSIPAQAGAILLSLLQGMSDIHAHLLLSLQHGNEKHIIEEIVMTYAATMEAIERVLGTQPLSFSRIDASDVDVWIKELQQV